VGGIFTGGIGSGKTIICQVFNQLKIPVYNADIEAKKLYDSHVGIRKKMIDLFGENIYEGQKINRSKLAGLIFHDRELLLRVNKIVHPEVIAHYNAWCNMHRYNKYVIQESAILFESNVYQMMDVCITVTAPMEVRLIRIMQRPGMTESVAESIMQIQLPDEIKVRQSDFVIENDNKKLVIPQVLNIHRALMEVNDKKKKESV